MENNINGGNKTRKNELSPLKLRLAYLLKVVGINLNMIDVS